MGSGREQVKVERTLHLMSQSVEVCASSPHDVDGGVAVARAIEVLTAAGESWSPAS